MKVKRSMCLIVMAVLLSIAIGALDLGDVNADRLVNIIDALLIARYYVGLPVEDFYEDAADVNCSEEINIIDALLVAQYYVGLLPELACPHIPEPDISIELPDLTEITSGADPAYLFYEQQNGESLIVTFTIRNNGDAPLQLTTDPPVRVIDEGTSHNWISVIQQPSAIIESGESTVFTVQYTPENLLYTERKSWITIENTDPYDPVYEFSLAGYNIGTYNDYFTLYPQLADQTVNSFNQKTLYFFLSYISELEQTGVMEIEEPYNLQNAVPPEGPSTIYLIGDEHWSIWGAKAAHAIWLDKNEMVPWKLEDYSVDDLPGLFEHDELFDSATGTFFSVVDYSPSDIYGYMVSNSLIGATIEETFHRVLDDLRTTDDTINFLHGSESYGDPDTAYSILEALTTYIDRGAVVCKIARRGCHSMTRIIVGMLRSVNIPGQITTDGTWFYEAHSEAFWPCVQMVMPHGDDLYAATIHEIPTGEFLIPMAVYSDPFYTNVCGTDNTCTSERYQAIKAFTYPANWVINRCCDPETYGYVDCYDYITQDFGDFLTPGEIDYYSENFINCQNFQ